jgi:CDP-diacylglycerol--serine O-phosphatidyltransferase
MTKYIPSLFTSFNLLCGFIAILVGDYYMSSILLLICIGFDALDGLTARALNAQSSLGKELDSLADMVSFGIAPAYLYFLLSPFEGLIMYLVPCLFVLASALRLAKFNIIPSTKSFLGLPTPATAFFLVGLYFSYHYESEFVIALLSNPVYYTAIAIFFFFMMLSNLRMFSLKGLDKRVWSNTYQLMQLLIFVSLLFVDYKIAIPVSVLSYILLSFIQNITVKDN